MSPFTLTMSDLYHRLKVLGFDKNFVRQVGLPSWWNEELDEKPIAVLEASGHIAQRLNLDLESLILEDSIPHFKPPAPTKFKYHHHQQESFTPSIAQAIASQLAKVIAKGTQLNFLTLPSDPLEIRQILTHKFPQITLYSLLDYCWSQGIAVVYFNHYPQKSRKLAGMIQWVDEQYPVIVLSSEHPAQLAFDLGHELAHLALGHIKNGILLDESLEQHSDDHEEQESNCFAAKLLFEEVENLINPWEIYNCKPLAQTVFSLENSIHTINHLLAQKINWDQLSDDHQDYLEQILMVG